MQHDLKKIILGTVQLGMPYGIKKSLIDQEAIAQDEGLRILETAYASGLRQLDTARDYGSAESVVGSWGHRNEVQIFSKLKDATSLSHAESIFAQTLEALKLDKIHCLSLHVFSECLNDFNLELLDRLKKLGLIEKSGISLYTTQEIDHVLRNTDVEVIQSPFNILDHWGHRGDAFSKIKAAKKTLHVRSVFLQGLLLMDPKTVPHHLRAIAPSLTAAAEIAHQHALTLRELCLVYVLNVSEVDGVIIGVDSVADLIENLDTIRNTNDALNRAAVENIEVSDLRLLNPSLWSAL